MSLRLRLRDGLRRKEESISGVFTARLRSPRFATLISGKAAQVVP